MKQQIIDALEDEYVIDETIIDNAIAAVDESTIETAVRDQFEIVEWNRDFAINGVSPGRVEEIFGMNDDDSAIVVRDAEADNVIMFQQTSPFGGEFDDPFGNDFDAFTTKFFDDFVSQRVGSRAYEQTLETSKENLTLQSEAETTA